MSSRCALKAPLNLPDGFPSWLTLVVFIAIAIRYVGGLLAESSESWAKILGPLGRRWRKRGERLQRTHDVKANLQNQAEIDRLIDQRVEARFQPLKAELEALRAEAAEYSEYLAYDARWHRDIGIYGANAGWEFPPPRHLSLAEFRAANAVE